MWSGLEKIVRSDGSRFPFHKASFRSARRKVRRTTRHITTARSRSIQTKRSARSAKRARRFVLKLRHPARHFDERPNVVDEAGAGYPAWPVKERVELGVRQPEHVADATREGGPPCPARSRYDDARRAVRER